MIPVASAEAMRALDRRTVETGAVASLDLMEAAGAAVVRESLAAYPQGARGCVAILCGRGNNGGDGFVIARRLLAEGAAVRTFLLAPRGEVTGDALVNLRRLEEAGAPPEALTQADLPRLGEQLASAGLIVDAMLGTGSRGPARGLTAEAIAAVNRAGRPVVAVDLPSGLAADSPEPPGPAVRASLTVSFALPKVCLLLYPAAAQAGRLRVVDIGIPPSLVAEAGIRLHLLEAADLGAALPPRERAAHKGSFGHVLILAGSVGKSGAAALAALAAQRAGAGLVTVGTPASLNDILEVKLTEAMTEPLPETEARSLGLEGLERILRLAEGKSVVALGPGLSTHPATQELIRRLVAALPVPMVLDADGIGAFAGQPDLLAAAGGPLILTPHPGEFARLLGVGREECLRERLALVPASAARLQATLLLKTARSLVGTPEGGLSVVGPGNPGMATGGSGDVLTGLIAGLVAQGREPALATRAGAYLHALAGDLAAARLGEEAVIASDLIEALPAAMASLKRGVAAPVELACRTAGVPRAGE